MTGTQPSNRKKRRAARKRGKGGAPSQADVEALIGAYRAGRLDEAIAGARRFTQRWPGQAIGWNVLAASQQAAARPDEAVTAYERALELEPDNADAWNNLGLMLAQLGRAQEAAERHARALEVRPQFPKAQYNRGLALAQLGEHEAAEAAFRRVLEERPDFVEAYNELGNLHRAQGDLEAAESAYRRLLDKQPARADVRNNLGHALREQRRFDEAIATFRTALAQQPSSAPLYSGLGLALAEAGYPAEAEDAYQQALAIDPDDRGARLNYARALRDLCRLDEADAAYRAQLERDPDDLEALTGRANLLADRGQSAEAERLYGQALVIEPNNARLHFYRAMVRRFAAVDDELAALEACAREHDDGGEAGAFLRYALAKAYADIGCDPATVFAEYARGAQCRRAAIDYDIAADEAWLRAIAHALGAQQIAALRGDPANGAVPVFIVGMPRSGTTLVEQILASHPRVHAGGERGDVERIVAAQSHAAGCGFPDWVEGIDHATVAALGARYREAVVEPAQGVDRVTDKMPGNFKYLGVIAAMLPEARIVHLQRDAADTCLSCFCQLFAGRQAFTYDLTELGRYYRAYAELMRHWREVLPAGVMLEVRYEDLVGEPEATARAIVAHAGLEWDPQCLAFHERAGSVETASAEQVRQPLYRHAIGRWRPYREQLQPLFEALGPLAPADTDG